MTATPLDESTSSRPATPGASRAGDRTRYTAILAGRVALLLGVLALWELAAAQGWIDPRFFARPSSIWTAGVALYESGVLVTQTIATLRAVLLALVVGVPAGILAGAALGAFSGLDDLIDPFLVPLNSLPRIALAPLFIVWFGLTTTAKVAVAVSLVFFMLLFNTRAGIKNVDPDKVTVAQLLCLTRRQLFWKVMLPDSVPVIFAAVRLAVTYSLLGVVAAEMIGSRDGLGQNIVRFSNTLQVDGVFAVLVVLALLGLLLARLLGLVERWLLRWR